MGKYRVMKFVRRGDDIAVGDPDALFHRDIALRDGLMKSEDELRNDAGNFDFGLIEIYRDTGEIRVFGQSAGYRLPVLREVRVATISRVAELSPGIKVGGSFAGEEL